MVLAIGGAVAIIGLLTWLSWGLANADVGEQDMQVTLVCASCGQETSCSYTDMIEGTERARQTGANQADGVCRGCGKATLFRATLCAKCERPMLPPHAKLDGKPVAIKCPHCGAAP